MFTGDLNIDFLFLRIGCRLVMELEEFSTSSIICDDMNLFDKKPSDFSRNSAKNSKFKLQFNIFTYSAQCHV